MKLSSNNWKEFPFQILINCLFAVSFLAFVAYVLSLRSATFNTITCNSWQVVDNVNSVRIVAGTFSNGNASLQWRDKDGKTRIDSTAFASGEASLQWLDKSGKQRINAATLADGQANMQWLDMNGKKRIDASTLVNGNASVQWFDKDEKRRIDAATLADGQANVQWLDPDGQSGSLWGVSLMDKVPCNFGMPRA